ncbi:MAG: HD domain-containing protein [bacterium]
MEALDSIRELVKNEAEKSDWDYHIVAVIKYAKILAELFNANQYVVELAAILHDIGRIRFGGKDHDITGVPEAEKIMKDHHISQDIIDEVTHCIESHMSKKVSPRTEIAKIISNADAMAQFDMLPVLFYFRGKKLSFEDTFTWTDEKIQHNWETRLTIPEAKQMVEEKYKAIKIVLDANREYI